MAQIPWDTEITTTDPYAVSVHQLRVAAVTVRRVARWAPALDPTLRNELERHATTLEAIASTQIQVERILRGDR